MGTGPSGFCFPHHCGTSVASAAAERRENGGKAIAAEGRALDFYRNLFLK
jgi:hypothetical protein